MVSQNFYETEAKKILGIPPPRILTYSSIMIVICVGIILFVSYILPITVTKKFPATIDFHVVPSEDQLYNMSNSQMRQALIQNKTFTTFDSTRSVLKGTTKKNQLVQVTVRINRDGVNEIIPKQGDTLIITQFADAFLLPPVIQEIEIDPDGTYRASVGKGLFTTSNVVVPKQKYTVEVTQRKTNYLYYILNI